MPVTSQLTYQDLTVSDPAQLLPPLRVSGVSTESGETAVVAEIDRNQSKILNQINILNPITEPGETTIPLQYPAHAVKINVNVDPIPLTPLVTQWTIGPLSDIRATIPLSNLQFTNNEISVTLSSMKYYHVLVIQQISNPQRYRVVCDYRNGASSYTIPANSYYYVYEYSGGIGKETHFFGVVGEETTPKYLCGLSEINTAAADIPNNCSYFSPDLLLFALPDTP